MSGTPALTLQDLLNDIERNAYDGVRFTEEVDAAYTLAAEMGKTIDQLKAENAELREELDAAKQDLQVFSANLARLGVENAKLRKLVDGLTWCSEHSRCRQECPLYDVSEPDHCREVPIKRELGIEVWSCTPEQAVEATLGTPRTTHAVTVSDESTDCATGHCECELCGEPIDPWDKYCRHCGAEVVTDG